MANAIDEGLSLAELNAEEGGDFEEGGNAHQDHYTDSASTNPCTGPKRKAVFSNAESPSRYIKTVHGKKSLIQDQTGVRGGTSPHNPSQEPVHCSARGIDP